MKLTQISIPRNIGLIESEFIIKENAKNYIKALTRNIWLKKINMLNAEYSRIFDDRDIRDVMIEIINNLNITPDGSICISINNKIGNYTLDQAYKIITYGNLSKRGSNFIINAINYGLNILSMKEASKEYGC